MHFMKRAASWAVVFAVVSVFSTAVRAEDAKTPAELTKTIDEAIALLEAKSYKPLLERLVSPKDKEKMKEEGFDKIAEKFAGEKAEFLLKALKFVKTQTPAISDNATLATYSLKEINSDRPLVLQKVEGTWYLRN